MLALSGLVSWPAGVSRAEASPPVSLCAAPPRPPPPPPRGARPARRAPRRVVSWAPPAPPRALEQLVGGGRAPAARRVEVQPAARTGCPRIEDRLQDLPCPLDLVGPGEERRGAPHAVEKQRPVGVGG